MFNLNAYTFLLVRILLVLVLTIAGATAFDQNNPREKPEDIFLLDVEEPRILNSNARSGRKLYQIKCLSCHGVSGRGAKKGPPLMVYPRSEHIDDQFSEAVRKGVRQHHWTYGDMPAIKGVNDQNISDLISYVRALQDHYDQQDEEP